MKQAIIIALFLIGITANALTPKQALNVLALAVQKAPLVAKDHQLVAQAVQTLAKAIKPKKKKKAKKGPK